jgi:NAD(P)H-dependent flavin oxidoreductase YrpB (nitropropane dioxygenase family)
MINFQFIVLTPAGQADASLAIAACRAGAVGVFNAEWGCHEGFVRQALASLARHGRGPFGLKLADSATDPLWDDLTGYAAVGLRWLIVDAETCRRRRQQLRDCQGVGIAVLVELTAWSPDTALLTSVDGIVVKGHESGGLVGEETSFVLLQKALAATALPVYVRGGIGPATAGACAAIGAAGAVLDNQLLLLRESPVAKTLQPVLRGLVGTETLLVGDPMQGRFLRVLDRPGFRTVRELRLQSDVMPADELLSRVGWQASDDPLLPAGQDVAFAAEWAGRYVTVGRAIAALRRRVAETGEAVRQGHGEWLAPESPLARAHGCRYPIVQGPMSRVSDNARFARAVAATGGLPTFALALMPADLCRQLLQAAALELSGLPWGVGLLGFAPADLLSAQIAASLECKPAFAILAGGRPEQAADLESKGIATYLHVPSPRLLAMFLEQGARRFIFEGRECGGHIGPLASFVLFESMVSTLRELLDKSVPAHEVHVLFAGGIHDARSASVSAC